MAHTEKIGKGMVTVILDGGSLDYITPDRFVVTNIYWLNVNATDKIILREYVPELAKADMPYIPIITSTVQLSGLLPPPVSIRYLVDYAASTTPSGNTLTFIGRWG
jgi:hypothetical protein